MVTKSLSCIQNLNLHFLTKKGKLVCFKIDESYLIEITRKNLFIRKISFWYERR